MAEIFADAKLYRNGDGKEPIDANGLKGCLTALYFSAGWCAPCCQFTPQLRQFYQQINSRSKNLELVFISADRSEAAMMEYLKEHGPWLYMEYASSLGKELKTKYGVRAMPALVVIRPNGKIVTLDGADEVQACFSILDESKADNLLTTWQAGSEAKTD